MIRLDVNVIHFLNQFAQRSWFWDRLISNIGENEFLTGGFIMAIIWWA